MATYDFRIKDGYGSGEADGSGAGLSPNGGISHIINDDTDAEWRIRKTSNGSSHAKLLTVDSDGVMKDFARAGKAVMVAGSDRLTVDTKGLTTKSVVLLSMKNAASGMFEQAHGIHWVYKNSTSFDIRASDGTDFDGGEQITWMVMN